MSTHRRRALSLVLLLVAGLAAGVVAHGAAGPDPRGRDAIGTAIADLSTGYPKKHLEAAHVLIADPDAALPRLLPDLASRPQYERARFLWVISQLGERGRQAILERGADAFRDLAWLHSREREKKVIESLRLLKQEFLEFALVHLDGLEYTDDRYIVSQALTDLAEPSFVPAYGECLAANPSDKVAVTCVKALGAFNSPEAVRALAPALGHRSDEVRRMSRARLVVLGTRAAAAVAAVARTARSGDVQREEAVRALVEMRESGEDALAGLGPAYVPDVIAIALTDRDRVSFYAERGEFKLKVDAGVSRALERARPIAVPLLVAAMQGEKEPMARGQAIRLLFELKEPADLDILVRTHADASSMVRATAIVALGHLGGEAQVPPLLEMDSDPSGDVRWTVHWALVTLGAKAIPTLERAAAGTVIGADRPLPRAPAVRALAYMGEPGLEALRRTHASAFDDLMEGLRRIGNDQQASTPLATAIRRVAGAAAATRLLGMFRQRGGSEVRQAAIRMLAQIADVPASRRSQPVRGPRGRSLASAGPRRSLRLGTGEPLRRCAGRDPRPGGGRAAPRRADLEGEVQRLDGREHSRDRRRRDRSG
jgi:HEAT repeat protein